MPEEGTIQARDTVGLVLMGSEEAEAVVTMLTSDGATQKVNVTDNGCYYKIEAPGLIEVDLNELSERLGREIDVPAFLVILASYIGRIEIDQRMIRIRTELLDLEGPKGPQSPKGH